MRFVVTGEWTKNRLLSTILWFFLGYSMFFWMTSLLLFFSKMGLSREAVVTYYLGDEARFLPARSFASLLEVSHFHFFAMGILLLTLTHLLLFMPISGTIKSHLIWFTFLSALASELAGWLIRFVHPGFYLVKLAGFVGLQASLGILILLAGWALRTRAKSAYGRSEDEPSRGGCPF